MTAPTGWHPGEPLPADPVVPNLADLVREALHDLLPMLVTLAVLIALLTLLPLIMRLGLRLLLLGMTTSPAHTGLVEEEVPLFTAQQVMDTLTADVRAAIEEGPPMTPAAQGRRLPRSARITYLGALLLTAAILLPRPASLRAALVTLAVLAWAHAIATPDPGDPPRGAHPDEEAAIRAARLRLRLRPPPRR